MRNSFAEEITRLGKINKKIVLLSGDIGNRLFDNFRKFNKKRFYNCGIAEACMTGVASGIASTGLIPITYTITPFNTMRCLEQIKLDICYPNHHAIIVGTGSGLSYASLGSTHHSFEDISIIRSLPNISVLCPSDPNEVKKMLIEALKIKGPVYLRLGKKNEPNFNVRKKIGNIHLIQKGNKNCLISVGSILNSVMDASKMLKSKRINHSVYDLRYIKPLNKSSILKILGKYKNVFVVEEHYKVGGAFSAILEKINNKLRKIKIYSIAIENKFIKFSGNHADARKLTGLDSKSIAERVEKLISK